MLTSLALARARFTFAAALAMALVGLALLIHFPATEEPTVPVRVATVEVAWPGATPEQMEALVARPIEAGARELGAIKSIETMVRPATALLYVTLRDDVRAQELPGYWQKLRAKLNDAARQLPEGAGPVVIGDDFGRVAVRSFALTGPGYPAGVLLREARRLRERLSMAPGVAQVTLHGAADEHVKIELSPARLAAAGTDMAAIAQALGEHNRAADAGRLQAGSRALTLHVDNAPRDAAGLARLPIALRGGGFVPLGTIARITVGPADPPASEAYWNGDRAIVLGVAMQPQLKVLDVRDAIDARAAQASASLPAGMALHGVTDQATVVLEELSRVGDVLVETVVIVIGVVVLFLGWRAGLVTGAIVPLTTLGTLIIMRLAGIELHIVSIAAVIIALGLFVDNGIVVIEDFQRRVAEGEARAAAAGAAGQSMAAPLLISSLAIILAFAPLVMGDTATAEYMRSLGFVMAVTLLLSLVIALTVIPLLAQQFAQAHKAHGAGDPVETLRRWYGRMVRRLVKKPRVVVGAMALLLSGSLIAYAALPVELLSPSERKQLQLPLELTPGTTPARTAAIARAVTARLADPRRFPEVAGAVAYVGEGGPRFILGLNPPIAAPHRAYIVVNLHHDAAVAPAAKHIAADLANAFPEARIESKRFSLGSSENGRAVFRLVGPDRLELVRAAEKLRAQLSAIPDMVEIRDDAEAPADRITVAPDPLRAAAAGVTSADVTRALGQAFGSTPITMLRRGELLVPVLLQAPDGQRHDPIWLAALPIQGTNGSTTLGAIAKVRLEQGPNVLNRRNLEPVITISARHATMTAAALAAAVDHRPATLGLAPEARVELGGEIEESVDANAGLQTYLPLAIAGMAGLFLWQFGSFRRTFIILLSIPFVLVGATAGLWVARESASFTATLGLLALMGIIVNNAVLLIGRIAERTDQGATVADAIAEAAELRLRPIVMTKLTCIVGLVPLYLSGGALWRPMAAAMIGGLALGTLITLALIPALYALLFKQRTIAPVEGLSQ